MIRAESHISTYLRLDLPNTGCCSRSLTTPLRFRHLMALGSLLINLTTSDLAPLSLAGRSYVCVRLATSAGGPRRAVQSRSRRLNSLKFLLQYELKARLRLPECRSADIHWPSPRATHDDISETLGSPAAFFAT